MGDPAKTQETLLVQLTVGELKGVIRDAVRDAVREFKRCALTGSPYIDTETAAKNFGVDPRTIRNWIHRGAPAVQIGRDYRIRLPELERWVDANRGLLLRYKTDLPQTSGVYAVMGHEGWVKIGRANNIADRMAELQVGCPVQLRLVAILSFDPADEPKFHARWSHLRDRGEWFRVEGDLDDALRAAREATGAN